ncbi:MAG: hypothetical protein HFJ50_06070 [Clostridia bacterium]|jgi:hypothetical protein|nr:hypothetical protein [Clostridia bacterium]
MTHFLRVGETPQIKSILDMYGVNLRQDGMIVEQDKDKFAMGMIDILYPEIESTDITEKITRVLIFDTGKLEFAEDLEALNVTRQDILKTSETSFYRTNLEDLSTKPAEGETVGESVIAAILEKNVGGEEEKKSKLVIFANNAFATDYEILQTGRAAIDFYENKDLIINSTQYVAEIKDAMTIRKEIKVTNYTATETQNKIVQTIIFGLPIFIIILGIVIWQLRRRKK